MLKKTKLPIRHLRLLWVLAILILASLACTQEYLSPMALTATAYTPVVTRSASTPDPVMESTPNPDSSTTDIVVHVDDPTPVSEATPNPTPTLMQASENILNYTTQNGDDLKAIALRFDVKPDEILQYNAISRSGFLPVNLVLTIPDRNLQGSPTDKLLPDSEVIYSPTALELDLQQFVQEAGGYLSTHRDDVGTSNKAGWEIVQIAARDNSINPRLLLSILEYQSHWVYGYPTNLVEIDYPMGYVNANFKGLYKQLGWAARLLEKGFYGWRTGSELSIKFHGQSFLRCAPSLNAGSVAIQYLLAELYPLEEWFSALYSEALFLNLHKEMFGDVWLRAEAYEPYLTEDLAQPELELPFPPGHTWNFTGGPHEVWGDNSPFAALDFAPIGVKNCDLTNEWITASAPGVVIRSASAIVVLDLDGDGYEQTGWVLFYLHVADKGRVPAGTTLKLNDHIGHPSCEGGNATGTHVHIARKYNGEWMPAGGTIPFNLSGWVAQNGAAPYLGTLIKHEQVIQANVVSSFETSITR